MPHRKITRDEVERVAQLAHLRFSPDEIDAFTEGFDRIIAYVEKLGEVDTGGVEPMTRTTTDVTPPRPDEAGAMLDPAEALKNAPKKTEGFFRVPKVIDEAEP